MPGRLIRPVRNFRVPVNTLSKVLIWCAGVFAIIQGAGILIGGPTRWSSPSFVVLRQVPHYTLVWGLTATVLGTGILAGSILRNYKVKGLSLFLLSVWSLGFSAGSLAAITALPTSATTGGPTYLFVALVCVILIFVDERSVRRSSTSSEPPPTATTPEGTTSETS